MKISEPPVESSGSKLESSGSKPEAPQKPKPPKRSKAADTKEDVEKTKRRKKEPVQVSETKQNPSKRSRAKVEVEIKNKEEKMEVVGPAPPQVDGVPATWARRRRPKTTEGALKWDTLRAVFIEQIKPHLSAVSVHEVRGGKTMENYGTKGKPPKTKAIAK